MVLGYNQYDNTCIAFTASWRHSSEAKTFLGVDQHMSTSTWRTSPIITESEVNYNGLVAKLLRLEKNFTESCLQPLWLSLFAKGILHP